ncbi:KPN_02809 family neutral zinc metallopeptidase [Alkanindiges illinoisensis]|uniref:Neutral zinc metallopeptidase n=1 Tax=Alkanindiges illinoisensis TaxID=197183 RepID=A0A4Y7XCG6_9GAMM|nr:neutral zinc metallopeptidase [Alkanindiges illinoisensis]TEU27315.1 neutral zinc metallopeptidase [Alkanindiges illinoisensis]
MRWKGRRESNQVEDLRGNSGSGLGGGVGPLALMGIFSRLGIKGTIVVVILGLIVWKVFGINPLAMLGGQPATQQVSQPYQESAEDAQTRQMVSVILADTEDTWQQIFASAGKQYQKPTLVLFRNGVQSGCGAAQSAMGPFYCPADQKVYIDLSFFQQMRQQMGISGDQQNSTETANTNQAGDFAEAYVIAHEVGHHVQNLLGISSQVQQARQQASETQGNALSVRQELQADCYAGVWAHHNQQRTQFLQAGDVEEAMDAAHKIGDDYLQKQARGYVVPDSFTHGTSQQRARWFNTGLNTGDLNQCDTFNTQQL